MPTLSVVMVTWNSAGFLASALSALRREAASLAIEVVVVDNGSTDGSLTVAAATLPDALVVRNPWNKGVARARNQGFAMARGRYVLFLDSDAEVMPGSLSALVAFMEAHPSVGLAGPRLVSPDGTVQCSCRRFPTLPGKLGRQLPLRLQRRLPWVVHEEMLDVDRSTSMPVDYVVGACQLIRPAVFRRAGGLDERIFYGPEDVDFCLRVWQAGWEVWYVPQATVVHHEQRVTRRRPGWLTGRHAVALAYYFTKHRYLWRRPDRDTLKASADRRRQDPGHSGRRDE
ncbi:MAG: glycosyltransferase family 2 protein [Armatimonadota bacterium]|nr:glycosyltransferase family 2 protein [Armatimonadota bacterium]